MSQKSKNTVISNIYVEFTRVLRAALSTFHTNKMNTTIVSMCK